MDEAARDGYAMSTVSRWIAAVRNYGINSLYVAPRYTEKLIDGDPTVFRALASGERNPTTRKTLEAMALLSEGSTLSHAAIVARIGVQTLRNRLALYRTGGLEGLRNWRRVQRFAKSTS